MVRKIARTLKDAVLHDFITTTHTAPGHAKVSEFTRYVGQLCTQREIDIYRLAQRLTMDPTELLRIINGRLAPTNAVLSGLARELDADVRHLEKLAGEIR
jgi:ribosome-binding protein aMBF1 (putative translation factor)